MSNMEVSSSRPKDQTKPEWKNLQPRSYPGRYQLLGSDSAGFQEFGRGAWSVVFKAIEIEAEITNTSLMSSTSPPFSFAQDGIHADLAIKAPSRRDAREVLEKEARMLTYLQSFSGVSDYLVPFYGFDPAQSSLILGPISLNLEMHVKEAGSTSCITTSTKAMFDPIIGTAKWAHLALRLIDGLVFLHNANCVHGDIKPANILLHDSYPSEFLIPLFCDFSSSRVVCGETEDEIEHVSAITTDFASPELLSSFRSDAGAIVTPASDVFALATTLLMAAIGESPYAGASIEAQKLTMAKEGRPLEFARNGNSASRIMRGKMVEKVLMGALEKVENRSTAAEWKTIVADVLDGIYVSEL
ncbi:hypothetical protein MMC07_007798 [Pseudocyphellaria aurata]|nr:hypothetical protein [Pseudocyphellaria aurata]